MLDYLVNSCDEFLWLVNLWFISDFRWFDIITSGFVKRFKGLQKKFKFC